MLTARSQSQMDSVVVVLPDTSNVRVPIHATTRLWHVLGLAAQQYGATEFEASQWKAFSVQTGELLPGNLRACALPPGTTIRVEAAQPPLSGGFQPAVLVRSVTTPRAAKRDEPGLMSVTVLLAVNPDGSTMEGPKRRAALRQGRGMKIKVAVIPTEAVSSLRDRVTAVGFSVDPSESFCVDGRVVVSEHLSYKDLRITPNNILSYEESEVGSSSNQYQLSSSMMNANSSTAAPRSRGLSSRPTSPSSAASGGSYSNQSMNQSMSGGRSGLRDSSSRPVSPGVPALSLTSSSQLVRSPSRSQPRRRNVIQDPGPVVRILVEDVEDGGYTYNVTASVDRQVNSLLQFLSNPEAYTVFCDGEPCNDHDTFLYATRGLHGCLFTFHRQQ